MKITVIISDADYQRIIAANGKRVKGSMAMIDPFTFDFHAWSPTPEPPTDVPRLELRTSHAKTTIRPDKIRLVVMVKRGEPKPDYASIIYDEADASTDFINQAI